MIRDYETFRDTVMAAGKKCGVVIRHIRRRSPFQAWRYKDEFVFPEAWAYKGKGELGVCINGADVSSEEDVVRIITDALLV